ncbi:MAG TPA: hypothetical protein VKE40_21580 [Gemmataceae bacterium]|nr:hypothetical protein [Gemmataceae bacterium]
MLLHHIAAFKAHVKVYVANLQEKCRRDILPGAGTPFTDPRHQMALLAYFKLMENHWQLLELARWVELAAEHAHLGHLPVRVTGIDPRRAKLGQIPKNLCRQVVFTNHALLRPGEYKSLETCEPSYKKQLMPLDATLPHFSMNALVDDWYYVQRTKPELNSVQAKIAFFGGRAEH